MNFWSYNSENKPKHCKRYDINVEDSTTCNTPSDKVFLEGRTQCHIIANNYFGSESMKGQNGKFDIMYYEGLKHDHKDPKFLLYLSKFSNPVPMELCPEDKASNQCPKTITSLATFKTTNYYCDGKSSKGEGFNACAVIRAKSNVVNFNDHSFGSAKDIDKYVKYSLSRDFKDMCDDKGYPKPLKDYKASTGIVYNPRLFELMKELSKNKGPDQSISQSIYNNIDCSEVNQIRQENETKLESRTVFRIILYFLFFLLGISATSLALLTKRDYAKIIAKLRNKKSNKHIEIEPEAGFSNAAVIHKSGTSDSSYLPCVTIPTKNCNVHAKEGPLTAPTSAPLLPTLRE